MNHGASGSLHIFLYLQQSKVRKIYWIFTWIFAISFSEFNIDIPAFKLEVHHLVYTSLSLSYILKLDICEPSWFLRILRCINLFTTVKNT